MNDEITWYDFDTDEAKGRIGVQRGDYGLWLYLDDEDHCIGLIDLIYQSGVGSCSDFPPHAQLIANADNGDALAYVKYLPQGTRLFFEHGVKTKETDIAYGQSYGYDETRWTKSS